MLATRAQRLVRCGDLLEFRRALTGLVPTYPAGIGVKAFGEIAGSPNQKLVMVPMETTGILGALAGIAGQKATNGVAKAPNAETQLDLFSDGVEALNRVAKAYPKLRKEARGEMIATWTKMIAKLPGSNQIAAQPLAVATLPTSAPQRTSPPTR